MRIKTLAGYAVEQHYSPNVGGKMTGHRGIVLHIAEGGYRGTISWQMNPDQRYSDGTEVTTSSTWIVGRNAGEIAQMVDTDTVAWCQRSGSYDWLSVELAGFAPQPPSEWQIEACAQLLVWAHRTYGVPIQVTSNTTGAGLGHHSMDNDTTVQWGHDSCPGAGVIAAKDAIVRRALALAAPPPPASAPTEEDDVRPYLMVLDQDQDPDSPDGAVFACYGSGAVRWIGRSEFYGLKTQQVPMVTATDPEEIDRLRRAAALSSPPAG
jgi:hypothetical protein